MRRFGIGVGMAIGFVFAFTMLYRAHIHDTMSSTFLRQLRYLHPIREAFNKVLQRDDRVIQSWEELRVELPAIGLQRWSMYTNEMVFVANISTSDSGSLPQILMISRQSYPYPRMGNMHLIVLRNGSDGPVNVEWLDEIAVRTNQRLSLATERQ
jgi:hypothetical protein